MIRKFSLVVLAVAALSGCVTGGYGYRGGGGDYYHGGRSSVDYYGYGAPYGSPGYGYPGGLSGSLGYGSRYYGGLIRYGYPYGYPYRYPYRYPYYGYGHHGPHDPPYRPPVVVRPPHRHDTPEPPNDDEHVDRRERTAVPWRDLDRLRGQQPGTREHAPARPDVVGAAPHPRQTVGVTPSDTLRPRHESPSRPQAHAAASAARRIEAQDRDTDRHETP